MRFLVLCIGKPRHVSLASAIGDYEQRARRYWPLEVRELRAESGRGLSPDDVRAKESARLLASVSPGAMLVACDARGQEMSSKEFAAWLQRERARAARDVTFIIGGAHGLADDVIERADARFAFARWTMPHELARLVLAEQLYRAGTIVRGEPYHK